jgi:hypothetical protein
MTKIAGSESGSGSISQSNGSPDQDPHQNVMAPEHCIGFTIFFIVSHFQDCFLEPAEPSGEPSNLSGEPNDGGRESPSSAVLEVTTRKRSAAGLRRTKRMPEKKRVKKSGGSLWDQLEDGLDGAEAVDDPSEEEDEDEEWIDSEDMESGEDEGSSGLMEVKCGVCGDSFRSVAR